MNKLKILSIGVYVALCMCFASCGDGVCDEQEVDLGLPSGTIWAGWNVGASSPEESGGYYAWGETEEKNDYSWETYKYGYYNPQKGRGININIGSNISGTQYDVVRQKWGEEWRMPTIEELSELVSECTWTWSQYKGVYGYKVLGPNGNSVFLPAVGNRYATSHEGGRSGLYWSASLNEGDNAWYLFFGGDYGISFRSDNFRSQGFPIRPVKSK